MSQRSRVSKTELELACPRKVSQRPRSSRSSGVEVQVAGIVPTLLHPELTCSRRVSPRKRSRRNSGVDVQVADIVPTLYSV